MAESCQISPAKTCKNIPEINSTQTIYQKWKLTAWSPTSNPKRPFFMRKGRSLEQCTTWNRLDGSLEFCEFCTLFGDLQLGDQKVTDWITWTWTIVSSLFGGFVSNFFGGDLSWGGFVSKKKWDGKAFWDCKWWILYCGWWIFFH